MIIKRKLEKKRIRGDTKEVYTITYVCDWCDEEFIVTNIWVARGPGPPFKTAGHPDMVSPQISCPRCKNFIKTWF